jgi:hypothetical protein
MFKDTQSVILYHIFKIHLPNLLINADGTNRF